MRVGQNWADPNSFFQMVKYFWSTVHVKKASKTKCGGCFRLISMCFGNNYAFGIEIKPAKMVPKATTKGVTFLC